MKRHYLEINLEKETLYYINNKVQDFIPLYNFYTIQSHS